MYLRQFFLVSLAEERGTKVMPWKWSFAVKESTAFLTSVAAELPPRSRETKRLTMGLLIRWVAKINAKGHQKLSIFLIVASPCNTGLKKNEASLEKTCSIRPKAWRKVFCFSHPLSVWYINFNNFQHEEPKIFSLMVAILIQKKMCHGSQ